MVQNAMGAQLLGTNNQVRDPDNAQSAQLAISADTVVKSAAGRVIRVIINSPGTAAGALYDTATSGSSGTAAANLVWSIPATAGIYLLGWPMAHGIRVVPGAGGQTLTVSLA